MQELDKIYYVVVVGGVPEAVTTIFAIAEQRCKELGSCQRTAMIIPTRCMDFEDFVDEEPTIKD